MPVIVATLNGELLSSLRIVIVGHGSRCHHHERRSHDQHPHLFLLLADPGASLDGTLQLANHISFD